jgi:hypothetical protein
LQSKAIKREAVACYLLRETFLFNLRLAVCVYR